MWGSIASQIGGNRVSVTSIVKDPTADPHDYETTTTDARTVADANLVILNGAGYDSWGQKLLDANPVDGRKVLDVAALVGKKDGDNPHLWYNPGYVNRVADQLVTELSALDSAGHDYYAAQRSAFTTALQPYMKEIASIQANFSGTKISATENVFAYMADALHLTVISPPDFMQAVAEGNDPAVSSVALFQDQIRTHEATVLVYNVQTVTAVTSTIKQLAIDEQIPVVGVSETTQPATAMFQDWQRTQLRALEKALETGTRQ